MAKKRSATKKILFVLLGLVALLIISALLFGGNKFGGGDQGKNVELADVEKRSITQTVTASGKVQPEIEVKISADVSGEVVYLGIREGDKVKKGDLLARIKADFYVAQAEQAQAGVSQAKAGLSRSKANLLKAELDFNRAKSLKDKNIIAESEFQTAQTQYQIAQADLESNTFLVESTEARLRESREQVQKTRIYAPINGTISQLNVELGERVVGTEMMTGTEIMIVAQLDKMELEADINENDVVNISLGDSAAIEVDAYPDQVFKGVVIEIANSARISAMGTQEQVTNFPVKIRISSAEFDAGQETSGSADLKTEMNTGSANDFIGFRPGMSGTVDIFTQTIEDAIVVPIAAVTVRDMAKIEAEKKRKEEGGGEGRPGGGRPGGENSSEGGNNQENLKKVIFVNNGGTAGLVEVETGISDDTHIVILNGLGGDEEVVVGPYSIVSRDLSPDDKLNVPDEEDAEEKEDS